LTLIGIVSVIGQAQGRTLFCHIPLPEIVQMRADRPALRSRSGLVRFTWENTSLWNEVKALGLATHIFWGHDHQNMVNYKTGRCTYWDADRVGGTVVTIEPNESVTIDHSCAPDIAISARAGNAIPERFRRMMGRDGSKKALTIEVAEGVLRTDGSGRPEASPML
jgi:hypothetical protein